MNYFRNSFIESARILHIKLHGSEGYGLKAVFVNKDRTPKISHEYPVTNTPRSGFVRDSYKCGEDAVKILSIVGFKLLRLANPIWLGLRIKV